MGGRERENLLSTCAFIRNKCTKREQQKGECWMKAFAASKVPRLNVAAALAVETDEVR